MPGGLVVNGSEICLRIHSVENVPIDRVNLSVCFGDGGNPLPSGEVSFCDRVNNPKPPSPLRGEGWDEGDEGYPLSTPTPAYRQAGLPSPIVSGGGDF